MDEVSMDDGLDGPESLVFGLGAAETAALVVALLGAWACVARLPAVAGWPAGLTLAASGALLGWGRHDDRTLLAWSVLAARFGWRHRHAARTRLLSLTNRGHSGRGAASDAGPAVVLPLALPRATRAPSSARVVSVVTLRGGAGRTALACALAARLASDGRLPGRRGWRPLRVGLVDLDTAAPAASLRWGAALDEPPRHHRSGAVIHPASPGDDGDDDLVEALERAAAGSDVVLLDACWRQERASAMLPRCDDIVVLTEPTPTGWLDAYRSVAWLRRLGLRDRLLLVANRCPDDADFSELEGDLRLPVVARVPVSDDLEAEAAVASLAAALNRRLMGERGAGMDAVAG